MALAPQISDAEWEVMKVIWESPGALTAGGVGQRLEAGAPRGRRTAKTRLGPAGGGGGVEVEAAHDKDAAGSAGGEGGGEGGGVAGGGEDILISGWGEAGGLCAAGEPVVSLARV